MFVLISSDHPNKKVANLPRILTSAFPVCVVMFGESTSPAAYKKLSTHPAEYKLFPPVSGPAVERIVNKYIKDQTQKAHDAAVKHREGGTGKEGDEVISIRGATGDGDTRSFSSISAQNLLKTMLSGGEGGVDDGAAGVIGASGSYSEDDYGSHSNYQSSSGQNSGKGHWAPVGDPIHRQKGIGRGDAHGATEDGVTGDNLSETEDGNSGSMHNARSGSNGGGYGSNQKGQGGADGNSSQSDRNSNSPYNPYKPPSSQAPGPQYSEDDFLQPEGKGLSDQHDESEDRKGDLSLASVGKSRGTEAVNEKEASSIKVEDHFYHDKKEETIIARGTQEALDQSSVYVKNAKTETVEQATNVACIVIDSTRFSGYLVTAMGKDRKIDEEFIDKVRQRLFKFLKENGELMEGDENAMNIKIKQVDFEDWAMECADFLRKSIHKGDEVAMAFFPHAEAKMKSGQSADTSMATISIDDIKEDIPLDFGVYVYLPKNDKYVLYTPQGGKFLGKQKEKLKAQGVTDLHVKKRRFAENLRAPRSNLPK
ncbi:MAG: hypothetical protein ACLGGX_12295 [Bdellovibrionia bacterium]